MNGVNICSFLYSYTDFEWGQYVSVPSPYTHIRVQQYSLNTLYLSLVCNLQCMQYKHWHTTRCCRGHAKRTYWAECASWSSTSLPWTEGQHFLGGMLHHRHTALWPRGILTFLWSICSCLFRFMSSSYSWCSWTLLGCLLPSTSKMQHTLLRQWSHNEIHDDKSNNYDHVHCQILHPVLPPLLSSSPYHGNSHGTADSWCKSYLQVYHHFSPYAIMWLHNSVYAQISTRTGSISQHRQQESPHC